MSASAALAVIDAWEGNYKGAILDGFGILGPGLAAIGHIAEVGRGVSEALNARV